MLSETQQSKALETALNLSTPQSERPERINEIENKIRFHVYSNRIRVTSFFRDFDKFHVGRVSCAQFRRCLGAIMEKSGAAVKLTSADFDALVSWYSGLNVGSEKASVGTLNWCAFADSIDSGTVLI